MRLVAALKEAGAGPVGLDGGWLDALEVDDSQKGFRSVYDRLAPEPRLLLHAAARLFEPLRRCRRYSRSSIFGPTSCSSRENSNQNLPHDIKALLTFSMRLPLYVAKYRFTKFLSCPGETETVWDIEIIEYKFRAIYGNSVEDGLAYAA
jgi:hypothetical protein